MRMYSRYAVEGCSSASASAVRRWPDRSPRPPPAASSRRESRPAPGTARDRDSREKPVVTRPQRQSPRPPAAPHARPLKSESRSSAAASAGSRGRPPAAKDTSSGRFPPVAPRSNGQKRQPDSTSGHWKLPIPSLSLQCSCTREASPDCNNPALLTPRSNCTGLSLYSHSHLHPGNGSSRCSVVPRVKRNIGPFVKKPRHSLH